MGGYRNQGFMEKELEWLELTKENIQKYVPPYLPGTYFLATAMSREHIVYIGAASQCATSGIRERLSSYFTSSCHNPKIREVLNSGRMLYFMFRYSEHPKQSEAYLLQVYKMVSQDKYNRRYELKPLDTAVRQKTPYGTIIETVLGEVGLGEEQIKSLKKMQKYQELVRKLGL